MKKLALLIALAFFALTALTVPVSAAETSQTAPAMTPAHQIDGPLPLLERIINPLPKPLPLCSTIHGTCSPTGSTVACTDACGDHLSCTCTSSHTWFCQQEC